MPRITAVAVGTAPSAQTKDLSILSVLIGACIR